MACRMVVQGPNNEPGFSFPRWGWLFSTGPAIWSLYFWMERQAVRMGCAMDVWPLIVWSSLALTGTLMATMSYYASRSGGPPQANESHLTMRDGFLLGAGLLATALLVGVPTLISHPC
jgi:hypothetical protein